jgi:flagellar biogenesis protein FliO
MVETMKQHQKKYYGSLLFIVVLILATAVVLERFGSADSQDLVGMVDE